LIATMTGTLMAMLPRTAPQAPRMSPTRRGD